MRVVMLLLALLVSFTGLASEDNFAFDDPTKRAQFLKLTEELRCPMCQNQNIADSDAMIAADMRRKVYALLKEGKSEAEVIEYMKSRYGDFVHYQPPVTAATLWLWAIPVLFVIIALTVLIRRRRSGTGDENEAEKLARAEAMLRQEDE